MKKKDAFGETVRVFRKHQGILRTKVALREGIHPRTLYAMRDAGLVEKLSLGVYRLADMPPLKSPDLVSVAMRVPEGVICLISALAFHEITTQIPHEVYLAISRKARLPNVDYPPVRAFRFTGEAFSEGIKTPKLDGIPIRIYTAEKTLADCFKYRNKIGLDVAIESLKLYRERKTIKTDKIIHFAKVCRVEKIMLPYLEAVL